MWCVVLYCDVPSHVRCARKIKRDDENTIGGLVKGSVMEQERDWGDTRWGTGTANDVIIGVAYRYRGIIVDVA